MDGDGRETVRRLPRFHVLPEQMTGGRVNLAREQAHKAARVLRLRAGDEIAVLDGSGAFFRCRVVWVEPGNVSAEVVERGALDTESPIEITLCQSVGKGDKPDEAVRCCTEAGVGRFLLFESERSVARLTPDKAPGRVERLRAIAQDAAEQSLRAKVPAVEWAGTLRAALEQAPKPRLLLYEGGGRPISAWSPTPSVSLIVGPEGGFSENEVRLAREAGAEPVSLGPRLLRTEHAGFYAVAALLASAEREGA